MGVRWDRSGTGCGGVMSRGRMRRDSLGMRWDEMGLDGIAFGGIEMNGIRWEWDGMGCEYTYWMGGRGEGWEGRRWAEWATHPIPSHHMPRRESEM